MRTFEHDENRLLVLDDDPLFLGLSRRLAVRTGYQVLAVSSIDEFKTVFASFSPGLLLLDVFLANCTDFENVLDLLAQHHFRGRVILASGLDFRALESAARSARRHGLGIIGTVEKGRNIDKLRTLLDLGRVGQRRKEIVPATAALTSIEDGGV